mmetsp:Transcript_31165/g.41229  ORF Transcript_31165/g.41229 Transcript_31165/m.41229 type:complete len:402 (+) Transcript_31165:219-1424(+)|eukprot:CAMPEP_0117763176 /NCGR_PEP_ID=MMETSP0947-20121206/18459_1 /TAXON_ID=44440 /ORGANISM="Chattonella subsalsa, Strain CCMP2191" /LENGTH=401 /DNA_ID=CAMNT_0005584787 /DNA_START=103 /DNA_END=1308 /DNA_ORIENTATION=-
MILRPLYTASGLASSVMIAATKQHTGKTSVSMALLDGLTEMLGKGKVGYMKPIGQKYVVVGDIKVDNDVHTAKIHYKLPSDFNHMNPIVVEPGFTRKYLAGQINPDFVWEQIDEAYEVMRRQYDFLIVEGTGHTGVGSVIGASNAEVAARLGLEIVLVANGGVGKAIDDLNVNRVFCEAHGAHVRGIVVNKILDSKYDMVVENMKIIANKWGVQLLGAVPYGENLDRPSLMDMEDMFGSKLLAGQHCRLSKFKRFELVTTSLRSLLNRLSDPDKNFKNACFVTHWSRNDIILGILSHLHEETCKRGSCGSALLLTGKSPMNIPHETILDFIRNDNTPVMLSNRPTSDTMQMLDSIRVKMNAEDGDRTNAVVNQYKPYIDFHKFLESSASPRAVPRAVCHGT